jgi:ring-1,2-phenylacetyl-CoA epoxidase subunit PaaB
VYVTDTRDVYISPTTEGSQNVYTLIEESATQNNTKSSFEIYHLLKRGKQHQHIGTVEASTPEEAMFIAKQQFSSDKMVYNVWAIRTNTIRFTTPEEKDLWNTLPEKKFRDASDYKGGDKLKSFLERQS